MILHRILLVLTGTLSFCAYCQNRVTGVVRDASGGEGLRDAHIKISGKDTGIRALADGSFQLDAAVSDTLVVSHIGFYSLTVPINSRSYIELFLQRSTTALDEVVLIGYGEERQEKLVQSVATVKNEDLPPLLVVSPQELLQGQVAGVQVVNASGLVGATPIVKIRGVPSITSGGEPLYVLDGVPLIGTNRSFDLGGLRISQYGNLNPADIESVSILKDAAASAIYGSRGSNGVVLIQTKKGNFEQPTEITFEARTSWSKVLEQLDVMSADQYRDFRIRTGQSLPGEDPQTSFDWPANVVRTGFTSSIDLGIRGGTGKSKFYVGFSNSDQDGYLIGNSLKKTSGRVNLLHKAKSWLEIGVNAGITDARNDRVYSEFTGFAPITASYFHEPWTLPYDEDGNFVNTGFISNVLAVESLDINTSDTFRTTANIFGKLRLNRFLNFRSDFGIDRVQLEEFIREADINTPGGWARDWNSKQRSYVFTNTLNFEHEFNANNRLTAVLGMSYEEYEFRQSGIVASGFLSDALINTESASNLINALNFVAQSRLVGYFTRANYSFRNKYTIEASFRRDGSSVFGSNARYGNFYSIGAAWFLSQESLFENWNGLDALKFKINYGVTGNDKIFSLASFQRFESGALPNYNGESGLFFRSAGNPDLRWERSKTINVGFESSFWNGRLALNMDYYQRTSDGLILDVPIPTTNAGLDRITRNAGEIQNSGVDIVLRVSPIQNKRFTWESGLNISYNRNRVNSLPGAATDNQGRRFVSGSPYQRAIEGHSVNSFYLIRFLGVNSQTGDAEWLDIDGNPTTNPSPDDRVIVGDANPDWVGGWSNRIRYDNWDLNFLMNFSIGNEVYFEGLTWLDDPSFSFNKRVEFLNFWENPGDQAFLPSPMSPTYFNFWQPSTAQLRDGSYLRLRNITLGFSLPQPVLSKLPLISSLRIYLSAQNIWTLKSSDMDGLEPEVTNYRLSNRQGESFFTPPQAKTVIAGIQIKF